MYNFQAILWLVLSLTLWRWGATWVVPTFWLSGMGRHHIGAPLPDMRNISRNSVIGMTCHFWPCHLNVISYCSSLLSFLLVSSHIGWHAGQHVVQISLSEDMSRWHVVNNDMTILMTCHDIWPKMTTFLSLVLVILAFFGQHFSVISRSLMTCRQKCHVVSALLMTCHRKCHVLSALSTTCCRNLMLSRLVLPKPISRIPAHCRILF